MADLKEVDDMYSNAENTKKSLKDFIKNIFRKRKKRLLTDSEKEFQKYLSVSAILYLVTIIFGIVFAIYSNLTIGVCQILIGIVATIFTIFYGFFFFQRKKFTFYKFFILFAIVNLIVVILLFFLDSSNFLLLSGIWFMVLHFERLLEAIYLLKVQDQTRVLFSVFSIMSIVLGIFVMVNPFIQFAYREVVGIMLILYSVLNLSELSLLYKKMNFFVSSFEN